MIEWKEVGGPCAQDEQNLHHDLVKHGNCWTSRILVRILYYSLFLFFLIMWQNSIYNCHQINKSSEGKKFQLMNCASSAMHLVGELLFSRTDLIEFYDAINLFSYFRIPCLVIECDMTNNFWKFKA